MRAGWTSLGNRQYAGHGQSNQSDPEQRHAAFTASALSCDEGRQVESKGQDVEKNMSAWILTIPPPPTLSIPVSHLTYESTTEKQKRSYR